MEETCGLATLAQQNFLRVLVGLTPEQAAKVELTAPVRCFAQPRHRIGGRLRLEPAISLWQPEDQCGLACVGILKREDGSFDRVGQPDFGLIWSQQIKAAFQPSHHQRLVVVAGQVFWPPISIRGGGQQELPQAPHLASRAHCIACFLIP